MAISVGVHCHLKRALTSVTVLVGLLTLDGVLGPFSFPLRRVIAAAIMTVLLLAVVRPIGRLAITLASWSAVAITALAPSVPLAMLAYVFAIAMVGVNTASETSLLVPGLTQSCFTYVGLRFLSDLLPQSRFLGEAISSAAHRYLQIASGTDQHLSPTALGGPAIILSAVYLLWRWRLSGSAARLRAAVAVPFAWFLLLPLVIPAATAGSIAIFARGAWYGIFWVACAALIDATAPSTMDVAFSLGRRIPGSLLVSACTASVLIGITLSGVIFPLIQANRSILVHNRGGLDWDRPVFGKFGVFSGGMFGLLPVYARAEGYRFEILDKDTVRPDDLTGFQTLLLINSSKEWKGEELQTVRNFVASGGSLLVLGDHTNVFGLMDGFNSLLEGFGILFQFDAAYHARSTWRGSLANAPDAVASGWDAEGLGIAIGASLKLSGSARSLSCGRYGHSDMGVRTNYVGSFLGNYTYEEGEELGDVILIASATHGRGRVIVFGDTTPFQGSVSYSFPRSVGPIFSLLSRPTNIFERPHFRAIVAALLVSILLLPWVSRLNTRSTAMVIAMLFVGVAGGWAISRPQLQSPISIGSKCFLIDESHLPAVGHYEAKVNPSTVSTNLLRCGLRVANFDEWDSELLSKAKGIAFVAPQRSFTPRELEELLRFEEAGGVVLLALGYPDSSASQRLLFVHGLSLEARPLGTVPTGTSAAAAGGKEKEMPRFLDAWPIVSTSGQDLASIPKIDILYRAENDVTALFCRHGRGGLLLFSDTRFFSTMNIEDTWGHWVGNLALIHDVFRKYLAIDPDEVHPVFGSPQKPE